VNPKTLSGEIRMYKRRSIRIKNAINVYITTRVMKNMHKYKRIHKKCKESCEWSKRPNIHETVLKIRYERGRKWYLHMAKVQERNIRDFN
jgi:hypothetical protein